MTASRDPEDLIHAFLLEGQDQLHDQVYDDVRAEIEQKRQRVVIGPWRTPIMNRFVTIGLGAAAMVIVLFIGARLLSSPNNVGPGGGPTPTPWPSATSEPSTSAPGLTQGPFALLNTQGDLGLTVTIPGPGWFGAKGGGILVKNDADPPAGSGMIVFEGELYVYGDPCHWSTTRPDTPARTVDELVTALSGQASRNASAPTDISVGGYAGRSITLHVPDDAAYAAREFTECDQGYFGSWTTASDPTPARYHQGPGQIDELSILDVNGVVVVIDTGHYAGTPLEDLAELRAIVNSSTFVLP